MDDAVTGFVQHSGLTDVAALPDLGAKRNLGQQRHS
jgi:hypothetical protein